MMLCNSLHVPTRLTVVMMEVPHCLMRESNATLSLCSPHILPISVFHAQPHEIELCSSHVSLNCFNNYMISTLLMYL